MVPMFTATKLTPVSLPAMYLEPGRPLAYVYLRLGDLGALHEAVRTLGPQGISPRLVYAYHISQGAPPGELLGVVVLDVGVSGADEVVLSKTLATVPGVQLISVQKPESGLAVAEQWRPELLGQPAVVLTRDIIGGLVQGVAAALDGQGSELLYRLGREAGRAVASRLPPLLAATGLSVNADLVARRFLDLQALGWAILRDVRVEGERHGEATLEATFESAAWAGKANAPKCHYLSGFIAGLLSLVYGRAFDCWEAECQAAGASACRFVFEPAAR